MKEIFRMNKNIYESAFDILAIQNEMCHGIENLGLRFDYGDGVVGKALEQLLNKSEAIIIESLGLHEVTEDATCTIGGQKYPVDLEVLYIKENNPDWSITCDDFYKFFYCAIKDLTIRDLMWKAMVNRDVDSKEQFNALNKGRIGVVR